MTEGTFEITRKPVLSTLQMVVIGWTLVGVILGFTPVGANILPDNGAVLGALFVSTIIAFLWSTWILMLAPDRMKAPETLSFDGDKLTFKSKGKMRAVAPSKIYIEKTKTGTMGDSPISYVLWGRIPSDDVSDIDLSSKRSYQSTSEKFTWSSVCYPDGLRAFALVAKMCSQSPY